MRLQTLVGPFLYMHSRSIFLFLILFSFSAKANLVKVGQWLSSGESAKALEFLQEKKLEEGQLEPSLSYAYGILRYDEKSWAEAKESFESLVGNQVYKPWAQFHLGQIARQNSEHSKAKKLLQPLTYKRQPTLLKRDARYALAQVAVDQKHWRTARRHLYYLERRWRGDSRYPSLLWELIGVEQVSGRRWKACRWARKLYSRFPFHPVVQDWGIDLLTNKYNDQKLSCVPSFKEQKKRIRRLQWAGQTDRARQEITELRKRTTKGTQFSVDELFADFLMSEGFANEAMTLLLPYYEQKKKNFNYLNLLAKAAGKAGEYKAAIALYYRAHKMNQRSRAGRKALFRSAFLSYRSKDYDGATQKFKEFNRKYRRSGLTRDTKWHMAWIRYLKGDYLGAEKAFQNILKQKKRRRRWWRSVGAERIKYWLAMSYKRSGKIEKSAELFQELAKNKLRPYYSVAARYRLKKIADLKIMQAKDGNLDLWVPKDEEDVEEKVDRNVAYAEEAESEAMMEDPSEEDSEDSEENLADNEELEEEEEQGPEPEFKNPRWATKFERAKNFILLGLHEPAKWELYDIEKGTKKEEYLKALMYQYQYMEFYHRSSYIAELNFARQRANHGLRGIRYLWEYAYPKAYEETVLRYSDRFDVPGEFIWAIMRAESQYRRDATSIVGAQGLMQLMPHTAHQVNRIIASESALTDIKMTDVNIRLGSGYLNRLLQKFEAKIPLAAAAYNAGPHRVDSWLHDLRHLDMDEFIEHIPFLETRNYVKKVVKNFQVYQELYGQSREGMSLLTESVAVPPSTMNFQRETWEALN